MGGGISIAGGIGSNQTGRLGRGSGREQGGEEGACANSPQKSWSVILANVGMCVWWVVVGVCVCVWGGRMRSRGGFCCDGISLNRSQRGDQLARTFSVRFGRTPFQQSPDIPPRKWRRYWGSRGRVAIHRNLRIGENMTPYRGDAANLTGGVHDGRAAPVSAKMRCVFRARPNDFGPLRWADLPARSRHVRLTRGTNPKIPRKSGSGRAGVRRLCSSVPRESGMIGRDLA